MSYDAYAAHAKAMAEGLAKELRAAILEADRRREWERAMAMKHQADRDDAESQVAP